MTNLFDENILSACEKIRKSLFEMKKERFSLFILSKQNYSKAHRAKEIKIVKSFLQSVLHLLNATALRIYFDVKDNIAICDRDNIDALSFVFSHVEFSFIKRFHKFLFAFANHYNYIDDSLSYNFLFVLDFLYKVKDFVKNKFNLSILEDINDFLSQDGSTKEYKNKIAEKLENSRYGNPTDEGVFYISKTKPFFVNGHTYYELTVRHANESFGKSAKLTLFSKFSIPSFYAVRLKFFYSSVYILKREMRIRIIDSFKVSIRMIEFDDLASILNNPYQDFDFNEYDALMEYLTDSGYNILDIIDFDESEYKKLKSSISPRSSLIFNLFDKCRDIQRKRKSGYITLRYILFKMRHRISKKFISEEQNSLFSNLYLKTECLPFENMPFASALPEHNPYILDVFMSIERKGRIHEFLATKIENNSERGLIFTPLSQLDNFDNVRNLVEIYNSNLPQQHFDERKLLIYKEKLYISGYVHDSEYILKFIAKFVGEGIPYYENAVNNFFNTGYVIDSPEKSEIISRAFIKNRVIAIFGSAGTGKTLCINHLAHLFEQTSKLFLAKTNAVATYLQSNVTAENCTFGTIDSWLFSEKFEYDILFLDDCPSISNRDMKKLVDKISCKILVLAGDLFQIQSIRLGNWFSLCKYVIPERSTFELSVPYRTQNIRLAEFFNRIRTKEDNLFKFINENKFRSDLDDNLFYKEEDDEVILCFDYDGLFGINNLNGFLQNNNSYVPEEWDSFLYKYGDPIIFAENNRYSSVLHKNLKGKIVGLDKTQYKISFKIEVFDKIDVDKALECGLEVYENKDNQHTVIGLTVDKYEENIFRERTDAYTVPFRLAYALSIYKVQGMEFDSVKIIISEESLKNVTFNLFYTAVTRAKKRVKLYCTENVLEKLIENISRNDLTENVKTFAKYVGIRE